MAYQGKLHGNVGFIILIKRIDYIDLERMKEF